jgi:CDP-4-dehydro-6-deoxyglucose reductase
MSEEYQVELLPSGRRFSVPAGATVLDAALEAGIVLPYQCRSGICGMCAAPVVSGSVVQGEEAMALMPEEIEAGVRLLCCSRLESDATINCQIIPGIPGVEIRKMPLRVIEMDKLASDVMRLRLRAPSGPALHFISGQYIDILLADGKRRSYSFAVAAAASEFIELHVRHMPGGLFTDQVFEKLKVKDVIRAEGPFGTFSLRKNSNARTIMLASGTGFAPIKAIVEETLAQQDERAMTLYWGGRRPTDLYMHALCEQWTREYPERFSYVPVLSDAIPDDAWEGRTGWVHEAVMQDNADMSGCEVYACGAPPMIEAAQRDFTSLCGLPSDAFYADAFLTAADVARAEAA